MYELTSHAEYLIATAARAPSVHNTQPWRFRLGDDSIDLYCDPSRQLRMDPSGREMLISCGAALFGLRLAIRSLGLMPVVELLPSADQPTHLARILAGAKVPATKNEEAMLMAMTRRHTHRGAFEHSPLPEGLPPGLRGDAAAEGAELMVLDRDVDHLRLADIVDIAGRELDLDPRARADLERWTRDADDPARDGIPARATGAAGIPGPWQLRQRDFGGGHATPGTEEAAPAVSAILLTRGDGGGDWLRAGQALHRLLLHAASQWVFASLYSQALESEPVRRLIRQRLELPGHPQMVLQLGVARSAAVTARRPPSSLIEP